MTILTTDYYVITEKSKMDIYVLVWNQSMIFC